MKQVQLTFNIETLSEEMAATRAMKADNAYIALWRFSQKLRAVCRYSEDETAVEAAEHWRKILFQCIDEEGINLDEELD